MQRYSQVSREVGRLQARFEESMEEYHNQVITSNEIRSTNESLLIQIQALNQTLKELNEEKNERSITIDEFGAQVSQGWMLM